MTQTTPKGRPTEGKVGEAHTEGKVGEAHTEGMVGEAHTGSQDLWPLVLWPRL